MRKGNESVHIDASCGQWLNMTVAFHQDLESAEALGGLHGKSDMQHAVKQGRCSHGKCKKKKKRPCRVQLPTSSETSVLGSFGM